METLQIYWLGIGGSILQINIGCVDLVLEVGGLRGYCKLILDWD